MIVERELFISQSLEIKEQSITIGNLNDRLNKVSKQLVWAENTIGSLRQNNKKHRYKLHYIVNMTLWQRLKFLFCPERAIKGV